MTAILEYIKVIVSIVIYSQTQSLATVRVEKQLDMLMISMCGLPYYGVLSNIDSIPYIRLFTQVATFVDVCNIPQAGYFYGCIIHDIKSRKHATTHVFIHFRNFRGN